MKKEAIQLLTWTRNIGITVTSIGLLVILAGVIILLSGCQKGAESPKTGISAADSPFNTGENGAWGKEDSFLRMMDLTDMTDELTVDDFTGGEFTLSDERIYAAAIYLHNTSDQPQRDVVITLSHPDILESGKDNQLEVLLGWGGADSGFISDQLKLQSTVDLTLSLVVNDDDAAVAVVRHGDGSLTKTSMLNANFDGVVTHMVELDEIKSGEACIVFFTFEALAAIQ